MIWKIINYLFSCLLSYISIALVDWEDYNLNTYLILWAFVQSPH